MEAMSRTGLSRALLGTVLGIVLLAAVHLVAQQPAAAASTGVFIPEVFKSQAAVFVNYRPDSADPWGHHSGRYDWNHYWTHMPPAIDSPPRPWKWTPFTMQLRRFPYAVPYHHMSGLFGGWTYDYRANATLLLNLFPDYVNRRVTIETRALHFAAYKQALDAGVGEAITWDAGNLRGSVTTAREGWSGRRYCREFRQDIFIDERPQQAVGTVCRERGGEWQIAPNQ